MTFSTLIHIADIIDILTVNILQSQFLFDPHSRLWRGIHSGLFTKLIISFKILIEFRVHSSNDGQYSSGQEFGSKYAKYPVFEQTWRTDEDGLRQTLFRVVEELGPFQTI